MSVQRSCTRATEDLDLRLSNDCRECGQTLSPSAQAFIDARTAEATARRDAEQRRKFEGFLAVCPTAETMPIQELHDAAEQYAVDHLTAHYAGDDTSFDFMLDVVKRVGRYAEWDAQ